MPTRPPSSLPTSPRSSPLQPPAASEVCEILGDALTLSETPIPLKIARLFLASDILHNTSSGVRNATRYRRCAAAGGQEAPPSLLEGCLSLAVLLLHSCSLLPPSLPDPAVQTSCLPHPAAFPPQPAGGAAARRV